MVRVGPRSIFVQDFVAVDRPFERVLAVVRGTLRESLLTAMVRDAWLSQASSVSGRSAESGFDGLQRRGDTPPDPAKTIVSVELSAPRTRESCLVVPFRWTCGADRSLLDADLEIFRFGADRTHVSLTGRAPVEATHWRGIDVADRLLLAVVRHFLVAVSVALAAAVDGTATTVAGSPTAHEHLDAKSASAAARAAMMGG